MDLSQDKDGRAAIQLVDQQLTGVAPMAEPETEPTAVAGCFSRLFWMFGGLVVLIFLSISIYNQHSFSIRDFVSWLLILALAIIRYVDIRYLHGQTAEGEPATMTHWRRYCVGLLSGALGA